MLSLEKPPRFIEDVLLYGDHADRTQFYYAPGTPKLAAGPNDEPTFDLIMYRSQLDHDVFSSTNIPDQLGSGFLTLGITCAHDPDTLDDVRDTLAEQEGVDPETIKLAPILLTDGSAKLIGVDLDKAATTDGADTPPAASGDTPQFVQSALGMTKPALLSDLKAVFSLRLSEEGSRFFTGLANQTGRLPISVIYGYEFEGLMPSIDCKITADTQSIKKAFTAGVDADFVYVKAEVEAAMEKLERDGAVKIELVSMQTGDTAEKARERAMKMFKEKIVQDLFNPSTPVMTPDMIAGLRNAANPGGSGGDTDSDAEGDEQQSSNISIGLKLKLEKVEETGTLTYRFRESSPIKVSNGTGGILQSLLSDEVRRDSIVEIDLATATDLFDLVKVDVLPPTQADFTKCGLRNLTLDVIYQGETRSLVFLPDSLEPRKVAFSRDDGDMVYGITKIYEFDANSGTDADAMRYEVPVEGLTHPVLTLTPEVDFQFLRMGFQHEPLHAAVDHLSIHLVAKTEDDTILGEHDVRFSNPQTQKEPEQFWTLRTQATAIHTIDVIETYTLDDGSVSTVTKSIQPDSTYMVQSPFRTRKLRLIPNALSGGNGETSRIELIEVDIRYQDPDNNYEYSFLVSLTELEDSTEISWPILNPEHTAFEYQVTVHEGGMSRQDDWVESDDTSLRVGSDVTALDTVKITLIGKNFEALGVEAVMVDIETLDEQDRPTIESFLFSPGAETEFTMPLIRRSDEQPEFRSRIQYFMSSGDIRMTDWKTHIGGKRIVVLLSAVNNIEA